MRLKLKKANSGLYSQAGSKNVFTDKLMGDETLLMQEPL